MAALTAVHDPYIAQFAVREPELAASGAPWLHRVRRAALERFAELGFPTTHVEEWKYTNVAPIARTAFEPAIGLDPGAFTIPFADFEAARVVVVNGRYSPALSTVPRGVRLCSLAEALRTEPELVQEHLARHASFEKHAFGALNTAFIEDGVFLNIPNGTVVERPIHIVFITSAGRSAWSTPRSLIIAGRDTQASIVETYAGDGTYFTNAVTEVVVGEGAVIDYTKFEAESPAAYHIGALHVRQDRSSNFTSNSIALGGSLVRNEIGAVLAGEGGECLLNGLYFATGRQHIDNYTTMDHAQPHSTSHELYKGILDGKAAAVFHGRIIVRPDAQKTDAIQRNKNLLLSDDAVINTKPQLEIYANDVRCTHGATVGQVDPDAVFYLRSRGIARDEARTLLTLAFAGEMLERLKIEPLRASLRDALPARLKEGR